MEEILQREGMWTIRWDDQHLYSYAAALLDPRVGPTVLRISHNGPDGPDNGGYFPPHERAAEKMAAEMCRDVPRSF